MKRIIIAIHGVGNSDSGEMSKGISEVINLKTATQEKLLIDGDEYFQIKALDDSETILEVNWSDIMKPTKNIWSVIKHIAFLVTSMLSIFDLKFADRFLKDKSQLSRVLNIGKLLRFCFESLLLGSVIFSVFTSVGMVIDDSIDKFILLFAILLLYSFFVYKSAKYSKNFIWGWGWLALCILYTGLLLFHYPFRNILENFSFRIREILQIVVTVLIFIAFIIYLWLYLKKEDKSVIAAEFSFSYLSYIAYNSVSTVITLASVILLKKFGLESAYNAWEETSKKFIAFDLAKAELATTIVYSIIGIVPITLLLVYIVGFRKKKYGNGQAFPLNKQGHFIQQGLFFLISFAPILLLALSLYLTYLVFECNGHNCSNESILEVYQISILRVLPFLLWFIGPLSTITDVLGDILFYIQPDVKLTYSIKFKCYERLKKAIEYAKSFENTKIVIVSHSWGTIVALDYLLKVPTNLKLITLGSPIQSLWVRFLGNKIEIPEGLNNWINGYRYGDYIAGPIFKSGIKNIIIGNGGHTNYWSDKEISEILKD